MPNFHTIGEYLTSINVTLTPDQLKQLERVAEYQYAPDAPHDIFGTELAIGDVAQFPDSDEILGLIVAVGPKSVAMIDINSGNHMIYKAEQLRLVPQEEFEELDEAEKVATCRHPEAYPCMPTIVVAAPY